MDRSGRYFWIRVVVVMVLLDAECSAAHPRRTVAFVIDDANWVAGDRHGHFQATCQVHDIQVVEVKAQDLSHVFRHELRD